MARGENWIVDAAEHLFEARRSGRILEGLPQDLMPASLPEAYAVQDALCARIGDQCAGWFVGCSNPAIQKLLGLDEPYCARLLWSTVQASPADLRHTPLPVVALEVEFAFRLSADLPPREEDYSSAEVVAALSHVHPSIEVVTSHFVDWTSQPIMSIVADNGTDGALVFGDAMPIGDPADLAEIETVLEVNGKQVRQGRGSNVLGNPINVMTWLANDCARRGEGLRAGHICNTGTSTEIYFAERGDSATARFAGLGDVTIVF
jgi:2-keto-4-pentenoate hydratase